MKQALEVLEQINRLSVGEHAIALPGEIDGAMDSLRAAIEQYDQTALELCDECGWRAIIPGDGCLVCARQKAKPVAWRWKEVKGEFVGAWVLTVIEPPPYVTESMPLYTAPRHWVGLTEIEICDIEANELTSASCETFSFARAIEEKLKEKNDG